MRPGPALRVAALSALALLALGGPARAGDVHGRVVVALPGVALADLRPVVVYLDAPEDAKGSGPAPGPAAELRQRHARFSPGFLVVTAGQEVVMPNDDDIYHNVFSFSAPNDFDLGLYPSGQSRSVVFEHPGVVRLYCSIHESMNGTVFVAPTSFATTVDEEGRFRLPDVPEGPWRLRAWSEKLPEAERALRVGTGPLEVELRIGETRRP
jgi:plastocyanin